MQLTINLTPQQFTLASIGAISIGLTLEKALATAALLKTPIKPQK